MTLEQATQIYATVLRQLLPVGGYDTAPNTVVAADVYAHAKALAQADLDAKRLLSVLEGIPTELLSEYEYEYGLPLKCTVNASRTFEERLQILNWVRTSRNVLNRAYLEQLLAIFGVVLIDLVKFKPLLCTAACDSPVNTEQLRYKVFLRLQYPMNADMSCIVENYLPGYLRIEWMVDMPWGDWILNSGVTVNASGIAHYTAYKTNQREYYDSYANLDLTEAIIHSLSDPDIQQAQAVKDAILQLTTLSNGYTFDSVNKRISYTDATKVYKDNKYLFISDTQSDLPQNWVHNPMKAVEMACAHFATVQPAGVYTFEKWQVSPDQWIADKRKTILWTVRNTYPEFSYTDTSPNQRISAKNDPNYNANNPLAKAYTYFNQIVAKIISNSLGGNLIAKNFLESFANSIFNPNESKQFVKLSDLLSQFELNKTLRT